MTPNQFRKVALSLPDVTEGQHMGHADFRVRGKIVASLGFPDDDRGMIKVTPDQQAALCASHAEAFQPCNGAWGRQGCTAVRLSAVRTPVVRAAFGFAVQNIVAMQPAKASGRKASPKASRKRR